MIKLKYNKDNAPFNMPVFNCIAVGRAYELLRDDLQKHLYFIQKEIGFKYCRFHGLFHDDMNVVIQKPDGTIGYQWHQINKIYDSLLSIGLRPFVEINPMPKALASGQDTMFWYKMNVTPPKSYQQWGHLIDAFGRHLIHRYGIEEIRQWYFEVWNEPNLENFWTAGQEEYWKLYDTTAAALKNIDAGIKVGGPATAGGAWIEDIIDHCYKSDIPIDFVSTHVYPQGEYCEYMDRKGSPHEIGEYLVDRINSIYNQVKASKMPDLEIHWTEWNTLSANATDEVKWITNQYVDSIFAASYIIKNCPKIDTVCNSLTYWVASDIFEEASLPHSPFSNTYGLVTIHGIPKASFNAFKMLRCLRGNRMDIELGQNVLPGCGMWATEEGGVLRGILYNHHMLEINEQPEWNETIIFPVLEDGNYMIITSMIKVGAGSAWESWCGMGKPHNISPVEEELLRAHSIPEYNYDLQMSYQKKIEFKANLKPNEVLYIEVKPVGEIVMPRTASDEELKVWNEGMNIKNN